MTLLALAVAGHPSSAQQVGTVVGRVVDGATLQPLASVQIYIASLNRGGLSDANGRFLLAGVPVGTHEVRAQRLGHRTESHTVTVSAGQSAEITITMREEAIALDEVVVTGTAGGTQRRAIGNVVETVDAASISAVSPASNVQQLLGQRTPGMIALPSPGQVGTGSPLRIRGLSSMSLANEPIVYIDGVRMDSDPRQGPSQRGGQWVNRLNDLNPEDIASIEIIKGPSAATLYGTEASNGVIQIITKRGVTSKPQFDITMRSGANWMVDPAERAGLRWYRNPATSQLESVNIYEHEKEFGTGDIFTTGRDQGLSGSVRGGTDAVRYFAGLSWDDATGVVDWNWDKRLNARVNLDFTVSEKFTVKTNTSYLQRQVSLAQTGTGFYSDPFSNLVWATPATLNARQRGFFVAPPEEWPKVETRSDIDRITTGLEMRFTPFSWWTNRVNAGVDLNEGKEWTLWPRQAEGTAHFWGPYGLGRKESARVTRRFITLDYAGSAKATVTPELVLTSAVGFQYYKRSFARLNATGSSFPALPITTVSGGSDRTGGEEFEDNATVGIYFQQQADWRNRVFLTGAVRADDNSAFGAEYDAAIYPKLSATWVLSDEPFWSVGPIQQFRLRSAWGAAGQQPGTFDAARLYDPGIGYLNEPALLPGAYGNPQLKPERSEELEYGFDAGLLDGRVELVFSRYQRWVKDAIVQRPVPPSSGFSGAQIVNLAEVSGWGNELSVNAHVMRRPRFEWDMGLQVATMDNRIEDLGGLSLIAAGGRNEHRAGYSIGAIFIKKVLSAEINSTGIVTSAMCDGGTGPLKLDQGGAPTPCATAPRVYQGSASPTWQVGLNSTFTLFGNLRLYGRIEGNGGHYNINTELRAIHNLGNSEVVLKRDNPMVQATRQYENDAMGLYNAGFLRLKEISATYTLPTSLASRFGSTGGAITLSGRNLMMLWTAEHGWGTPRNGLVTPGFGGVSIWDPEIRTSGQVSSTALQTVMPPFTSATLTVRLNF